MKILFKNLGIILFFVGIIPFVLTVSDGFKVETFVISIIFFLLGITLFFTNK